MEAGPVPRILAKQRPEGNWGEPKDFYQNSKYKGTIWNIILLAELCADPEDERIKAACEFVLEWSQERSTGGFSVRGSKERGGTKGSGSLLTSNMAFSLSLVWEGPRIRKALKWLTPEGEHVMAMRPYQYQRCWRDHLPLGRGEVAQAFGRCPRWTADMKTWRA
jgi:hypothetical protein